MKFYSPKFKRMKKNQVVGTLKEEQSALEKLLAEVIRVESVELKIKKIEVKGRTVVVYLPVMWSFVNHDHAHEMLGAGDIDTWTREKEGWRIILSNSGTGKFWAGPSGHNP